MNEYEALDLAINYLNEEDNEKENDQDSDQKAVYKPNRHSKLLPKYDRERNEYIRNDGSRFTAH